MFCEGGDNFSEVIFFSIYMLKWYIFDIVGTVVISLRIKKLFSFRDVGITFLSLMALCRHLVELSVLISFT